MIYVDGLKRYYYLIFAGIIVDYKKQVFITKIKTNMLSSIYYVFLQK